VQGDLASIGQLCQVDPQRLAGQQVHADRVTAEGVEHEPVEQPVGLTVHRKQRVAADDTPLGPAVVQELAIARGAGDPLDGRVDLGPQGRNDRRCSE
jgi:hypothetical protein